MTCPQQFLPLLEKFSLDFHLMSFSNQETQISLLRVVSRVCTWTQVLFKNTDTFTMV
jgi:hypothetical protein